jgi:hypothetical protein
MTIENVMLRGGFYNLFLAIYCFFNTVIHVSGRNFENHKDVFVVPNFAETQGVIVEISGASTTNQGAEENNTSAIRYAWKNGDFVFEKGYYTPTLSNRLSTVQSASGRFQGAVWEYSNGRLIQHGRSNTYEKRFAGKTAEELDLLRYLSKGMEIDDFATVAVKSDGTFSGKWLSTQPVQVMSGNISFLDDKKVLLKAWTPERLIQFESEIEYNYSISKNIPILIRFRHIVDGEPTGYQIRRVVFVDLDNSDAEFNPRVRYKIEKTLQMENDIISETNGVGKKIIYITSSQSAPVSKVRQYFLVLMIIAPSFIIFVWLKNKN